MDKVIAINQHIMEWERELNAKFIKEADAIWNQGEANIKLYPLFMKIWLYLIWQEYVQGN